MRSHWIQLLLMPMRPHLIQLRPIQIRTPIRIRTAIRIWRVSTPFRRSSWQNDIGSRNSRKKGQVPLCRNTSTSLPMEQHATCKFTIKLYHNDKGYYVSPKHGNGIHSNHQYVKSTNNTYGLKLLL